MTTKHFFLAVVSGMVFPSFEECHLRVFITALARNGRLVRYGAN
jgi:hypothetical protein